MSRLAKEDSVSGYFSFERLITTTVVKAVYLLGLIVLSAAGLALIVWAGMRLRDANIARQLGWRYVAVGAAVVLIGNLIWRVICEFWMVLFNIHDHLAVIDHMTSWHAIQEVPERQIAERRVEEQRPDARPIEESLGKERLKTVGRPTGVLGLS